MKALAAALVEAQKNMPHVERDARNPHFGSSFTSLDHLIAKTKPVLNDHGLAIVQLLSNIDGQPALTTTLLHAESGESISDTVPLVLAKNDMQGLGAASTYARRYSWASALGICDEQDDDGNTASAGQAADGSRGGAGGAQADTVGAAWARPDTATPSASPPAPAPNGQWTMPFGKHKGQTIEQIHGDNPGYLDWLMDKSDKQDIKDRIVAFRESLVTGELVAAGATEVRDGFTDPSDIPFERSIDGFGN